MCVEISSHDFSLQDKSKMRIPATRGQKENKAVTVEKFETHASETNSRQNIIFIQTEQT